VIDEFNGDRTGYAQFSDDRTMRYHLLRLVTPRAVESQCIQRLAGLQPATAYDTGTETQLSLFAGRSDGSRETPSCQFMDLFPWSLGDLRVVTFLLINPSKADGFKDDPTAGECVKFTQRWGGDITWLVNLCAFVSPYPSDLLDLPRLSRGDDATNDAAIMTACKAAQTVIAAWGNNGAIDGRHEAVGIMLRAQGVKCHHLGLTNLGHPKHPLARGKHRIPADQQPIPWEP
jgi:hypothetical protein